MWCVFEFRLSAILLAPTTHTHTHSQVVGVLLWNMFGKIPIARKIIGDAKTVKDAADLAKLLNVYE